MKLKSCHARGFNMHCITTAYPGAPGQSNVTRKSGRLDSCWFTVTKLHDTSLHQPDFIVTIRSCHQFSNSMWF